MLVAYSWTYRVFSSYKNSTGKKWKNFGLCWVIDSKSNWQQIDEWLLTGTIWIIAASIRQPHTISHYHAMPQTPLRPGAQKRFWPRCASRLQLRCGRRVEAPGLKCMPRLAKIIGSDRIIGAARLEEQSATSLQQCFLRSRVACSVCTGDVVEWHVVPICCADLSCISGSICMRT